MLLVFRFAQTAAAVALAGTLVLRLLTRRTDACGTLRWRGLVWGSWGVLAVASFGVLGMTTAAMTGEPFAGVFRGDPVGKVLAGTHFGAVWLVRAGLLAGVFAVEAIIENVRRRRGRTPVPAGLDASNLLLAMAVLLTLIWVGHAQSSAQGVWLLPVDALHAMAAGAWPGGLLPVALLLTRVRHDPILLVAAATIIRRFSLMSVAAVAVLALTGWLNSVGLVGGFAALWSGDYGRILQCKIALFLGLLVLGATNRCRVRRGIVADGQEIVRRMRRDVGWECVLAIGVLAASEALAMNAPPH